MLIITRMVVDVRSSVDVNMLTVLLEYIDLLLIDSIQSAKAVLEGPATGHIICLVSSCINLCSPANP